MKKIYCILIVWFISLSANAQINANWALVDNVMISFVTGKPIVENDIVGLNLLNSSVSDDNGDLLFYCGTLLQEKVFKIFDANNTELYSWDYGFALSTVGNCSVYKYQDKYYLFVVWAKEFHCFVLGRNYKSGQIAVEKHFRNDGYGSKFSSFLSFFEDSSGGLCFVDYEYPYFVVYKVTESLEFVSAYKYPINNTFASYWDVCIKPDIKNGKIYANQQDCFYVLDMDFDKCQVSNVNSVDIPGLRSIEFSESRDYLYMLKKDTRSYKLLRYKGNVWENLNFTDNSDLIAEVEPSVSISNSSDMLFAPDGNIYVGFTKYRYLSRITNIDSDNPVFERDVVDLGDGRQMPTYFPRISRDCVSPKETLKEISHTVCLNSTTDYFIDNPVEGSKYVWNISPSGMGEVVSNSESYDIISVRWENVGDAQISVYEVSSSGCNSDASGIEVKVLESPDAQFDNASLCYGEPLNVIFRGVAPFTLDYTLDGESFSIPDISTDIFKMPETAGKYSIIKVIDKNCSAIPENNNNAVIGKEMKKLKIKIGE